MSIALNLAVEEAYLLLTVIDNSTPWLNMVELAQCEAISERISGLLDATDRGTEPETKGGPGR